MILEKIAKINKDVNICSFIVETPLNLILTSKYYVPKEKAERWIVWGLGQNKKLLQYRLPEALSQWTRPNGSPITPQFQIIAHQKAGVALGLYIYI